MILLLSAGIGAGGWYLGWGRSSPAGGGGGGGGARAIPVDVAEAQSGPAAEVIEANGSLRAADSVTIRAEIAGRIHHLRFAEGTPVAEGAVLIELDADSLRAERMLAEAALVLARENYARAEALSRRGSGTVRALDEAVAQRRADEARLALAEARLKKATIVAPFAGVVGLRDLSVGQYVDVGEKLVGLEKIDPLLLDFRVAERFLPKIGVGMTVRVTVDAVTGSSFLARIIALDPAVEVEGRSLRVRAAVPNPDGRLRPGLFARVSIEIDPRAAAVLVPEAALVPQEQGAVVWLVEAGTARAVPVQTGMRRHGVIEIRQGVTAGTVVVVGGQMRLRDGAAVEVVGRVGAIGPSR